MKKQLLYKREDLTDIVREAIHTKDGSMSVCARRIAPVLGMTQDAVNNYLHEYTQGYVYGTISTKPKDPKNKLKILAHMLYLLEVSAQEAVIRTLQQDYGMQYPPAEEPLLQRNLEQKIRHLRPQDRTRVESVIDDILRGYQTLK